MNAVYIEQFGAIENLEIRKVSNPPNPKEHEVLVAVRAAGLNRADLLQRKGLYPPPEGVDPHILGLEFAGEIAAIGEKVTGLRIGDRVFGIASGAAQAEMLLSHAGLLVPIPENLSFKEAAAIPEAFITAHDAIFTNAELKAGETLLIHAVASGVGLAALQLAKAKNIKVLGTSRTIDKLERCEEFGLDEAIHTSNGLNLCKTVDALTIEKGVDVILDLIGAAYFQQNLEILTKKGRLVLVGLTSGVKSDIDLRVVLSKRLKIMGTVLRSRSLVEKIEATGKFATEVLPLLASGMIRPNIDRVFQMNEIGLAHEYLESNRSFGKVILEISG